MSIKNSDTGVESSIEKEIWVPCAGYENFLEVSNLARVRSLPKHAIVTRKNSNYNHFIKGRVLAQCVTKSGYLETAIVIGKKRKKFSVHRLVGRAFVPGFKDGLTINHINGVKTDNRPSNLEWVTLARNTQHQWEIGLVDLRGDNNPNRKLSSGKVRIIRRLLKMGASCGDLALLAGVSDSLIQLIKENKRWCDLPNID